VEKATKAQPGLQAFFRRFAKKIFIRAKIATMRKQKMPVLLVFLCFLHFGTVNAINHACPLMWRAERQKGERMKATTHKTMTEKQAARVMAALNALRVSAYKGQYNNPKGDAQYNLSGRTHYLRFFGSRVLYGFMPGLYSTEEGLLYAVIDSQSKGRYGRENKRATLFDVFGTVIYQTERMRDSNKAKTALYAFIDTLDTAAYYTEAITARADRMKREALAAKKALNGKAA